MAPRRPPARAASRDSRTSEGETAEPQAVHFEPPIHMHVGNGGARRSGGQGRPSGGLYEAALPLLQRGGVHPNASAGLISLRREAVGRFVEGWPPSRRHPRGQGYFHVGAVCVRQGGRSRYHLQVASIGRAASHLDLDARLEGPRAECVLDGIWVAGGSQRIEHELAVEHVRASTRSLVRFGGVAAGAAQAALGGRVVVGPEAVGAACRVESHGLLLSREARIVARPSLHVDARALPVSFGQLAEQERIWVDQPSAREARIEEFLEGALAGIRSASLRRHVAMQILSRGNGRAK